MAKSNIGGAPCLDALALESEAHSAVVHPADRVAVAVLEPNQREEKSSLWCHTRRLQFGYK